MSHCSSITFRAVEGVVTEQCDTRQQSRNMQPGNSPCSEGKFRKALETIKKKSEVRAMDLQATI